MPVLYTIYCIRNVASGMLYVGQTSKTAEERLRAHRRKSLYHQTYKTSLYHDMHLYGQQAFDIRVIDTIESQEFADIYEAYYIAYFDTYNTGYNDNWGNTWRFKRLPGHQIYVVDEKGEIRLKYEDIWEASRRTGLPVALIYRACYRVGYPLNSMYYVYDFNYKELLSYIQNDNPPYRVKQVAPDGLLIQHTFESIPKAAQVLGITQERLNQIILNHELFNDSYWMVPIRGQK